MKVTIKDVAELAGVSFKTVSRVVNNESGVKSEKREKVQLAISELNYQPNLSARRLRGKPATIGFIYNNPNSNYVITMLHGILATCRSNSYELVVHPCEIESESVADEILAMARKSMIAGLVLTPPISEDENVIKQLDAAKIKFVRIISESSPPEDIERTIYINDRLAAYNITQHLVDQNHKNIGFFNGDPEHNSSGERLSGYKEALRANNIAVNDKLIYEGHYTFESGMERAQNLLAEQDQATAIFACNDEIAAGALFAARMAGKQVPEELSIVGFEDSPFSRQSWPSLTTASQPNNEIASHATQILIDSLKSETGDEEISVSDHGYLPQIVIRESSTHRS